MFRPWHPGIILQETNHKIIQNIIRNWKPCKYPTLGNHLALYSTCHIVTIIYG